jgi:Pyruvate/2-oxoacid:ferredoxin oxidoreductase delta subunit
MDIPEFYELVEHLFTPEQAALNNALPLHPVAAGDIARALCREEAGTARALEEMADKGLCMTFLSDGKRVYRGAPFIPGIFEYQFMSGRASAWERRTAELIHAYKAAFDAAAGETRISFPLARVIPVERTIQAGNTIHTYDQVATYIDKYDPIGVVTCYCRHTAKLRGQPTHGMPMEVCMWFGKGAEYAIERLGGRRLGKAEAKELLDATEEAGLLHMSRNTTEEIDFLCNCDRWHCGVVSSVLKQPKPGWVFNSGFQPAFDPQRCTACGICLERCPASALAMGAADLPQVDLERCFGCAVCATGCPEAAVRMRAKPGFPTPPRDTAQLAAAVKAGTTRRPGPIAARAGSDSHSRPGRGCGADKL